MKASENANDRFKAVLNKFSIILFVMDLFYFVRIIRRVATSCPSAMRE